MNLCYDMLFGYSAKRKVYNQAFQSSFFIYALEMDFRPKIHNETKLKWNHKWADLLEKPKNLLSHAIFETISSPW